MEKKKNQGIVAPKFDWVTIGKLGATSLHWQLGKSGEYKDLKFALIIFIWYSNVCNKIPNISNDM